jgi:hypothetical protein
VSSWVSYVTDDRLGAPMGGLINDSLGWRWAFYLQVGPAQMKRQSLANVLDTPTRYFSCSRILQSQLLHPLHTRNLDPLERNRSSETCTNRFLGLFSPRRLCGRLATRRLNQDLRSWRGRAGLVRSTYSWVIWGERGTVCGVYAGRDESCQRASSASGTTTSTDGSQCCYTQFGSLHAHLCCRKSIRALVGPELTRSAVQCPSVLYRSEPHVGLDSRKSLDPQRFLCGRSLPWIRIASASYRQILLVDFHLRGMWDR